MSGREEEKIDPKEVRSRLRQVEDFNLAQKLQDEEFNAHYNLNRSERRTVRSDVQTSKTEQRREDEYEKEVRRQTYRPIIESDEQIARRMAAEYEEEERRLLEWKTQQLLRDEELARQLAEGRSDISTIDVPPPQSSQFVPESTQLPSTSSRVGVSGGIALPGLTSGPSPVSTRQLSSQASEEDWPAPPTSVFSTIPDIPTSAAILSSDNPSTISTVPLQPVVLGIPGGVSITSHYPPSDVPVAQDTSNIGTSLPAHSSFGLSAPSSYGSNVPVSSIPLTTYPPMTSSTPYPSDVNHHDITQVPPATSNIGWTLSDTNPFLTDVQNDTNHQLGAPPPYDNSNYPSQLPPPSDLLFRTNNDSRQL